MLRDDGGSIIPMFSKFIDGGSRQAARFLPSPMGYLSAGARPPRSVRLSAASSVFKAAPYWWEAAPLPRTAGRRAAAA